MGRCFFSLFYHSFRSPNLANVRSSSTSPQAPHWIFKLGPLYGRWKGSRVSLVYSWIKSPVCGSIFTEWASCLIRLNRLRFVLQFGHRYGVAINSPSLSMIFLYFLQNSLKLCKFNIITKGGFS